MKGKYYVAIALLVLLLLPLTLWLSLTWWLPGLTGIWLPAGTRVTLDARPQLSRHALRLPGLRYYAGDCELAAAQQLVLSRPGRWQLDIQRLALNPDCIARLPADRASPAAPRTLPQWQEMLPRSGLRINQLTITPWVQYAGSLRLILAPEQQRLHYQGEKIRFDARLQGQALSLQRFELKLLENQPPLKLEGEVTLGLMPDGLPLQGEAQAQFSLPLAPYQLTAAVSWQQNSGQLLVNAAGDPDPLLDLPWSLTRQRFTLSDGRWRWPYQDFPLSGRLGLKIDNWQQGLEGAQISGRANVLTAGQAGKGNAVLNIGPGKLSLLDSAMPLRLTGDARKDALALYASLPATLHGPLLDPRLRFQPGALLRARGRLGDTLDVDEVRWPLAGVQLTARGVSGRLQAIARGQQPQMGDVVLHLDGQADDFLPDSGLWRWRYWGEGRFLPMQARWDIAGRGAWQDNQIELNELSAGFDRLAYGSMAMAQPRLVLEQPVRWLRDPQHPAFSGALSLDAGETQFSGGSRLPPSTLKFSVAGSDPASFQFKGDLHAQAIGPVRIAGRWDGERLRGQAWWPRQPLAVFQPLIPSGWKLALRDGDFYAQLAFSAAQGQGFEAGGHGVVKAGSAWLADNSISGVDVVLPFRYRDSRWHFGTRGPVRLRIAQINSQVTGRDLRADLQGWYPWNEAHPLTLSEVSVRALGGTLSLLQLRLPQRDAALLRLDNISTSELTTALKTSQFVLSGAVNGALPLWLNHPQWIIHDGWLTNPGPLTLRLDRQMADALVADHLAAGAAINWLRYMEITRSWTKINVDNLGVLRMESRLQGVGRVDGKRSEVNLNYQHQENLFTLWRSLRFGDRLQAWLEQHARLPGASCRNCEDGK